MNAFYPLPVMKPFGARRRALIPVLFGGGERRIFADTFTDANGTAIADHVPDVDYGGVRWANVAGTFDIQNNRANPATMPSGYAWMKTGNLRPNFRATLTVNFGETSGNTNLIELIFRMDSVGNFWSVILGKYNGGSMFTIQESVGGVTTNHVAGSYTYAANTTHVLSVIASGSSIAASLNGGTPITWGSAATFLTVPVLALFVWENATIVNRTRFDELVVYAL